MYTAVLCVLASGLLHAMWNLSAKKSRSQVVFLWLAQIVAVTAFLPLAWRDAVHTDWSWDAVLWLLFSAVLHSVYVVLLAATYRQSDFSLAYPIMRGSGPLLVPLVGVLLLKESLSLWGWLGSAAIVAGIVTVSGGFRALAAAREAHRSMRLALSVGLCVASYIVVDKISLQYMTPYVLNEATNAGNFLALTYSALRSREIGAVVREQWRSVILGGLLAPGGYLLFLYGLTLAPAAQLAPMREIGTVFGTVLGVFLLREAQGARRLAGSVLITAGVMTMGLWGGG